MENIVVIENMMSSTLMNEILAVFRVKAILRPLKQQELCRNIKSYISPPPPPPPPPP